jgi:hypothetical protein
MPHNIKKALDKPVELLDETLDWVAGGSKPANPGYGYQLTAAEARSGGVTPGYGKAANSHGPN